jgi:hypothetical protein
MHAIGNAAEWCRNTEPQGGFILRGCSITTANIKDVRVTWRGQGQPGGSQDEGFRVLIPLSDASQIAAASAPSAAASAAMPNVQKTVRVLSSLPWHTLLPVIGPGN